MFDLAAFSADSLWAFLQIFCRVSALFVVAPVFGTPHIPAQIKIGLAAILSLVMLPLIGSTLSDHVPGSVYGMAGVLFSQIVIGLILGFVAGLLFAAVRMGGEVLDFQMGFSMGGVFNPQFNENVTPVANFQYQYALLVYLLANGHWLLIAALERSFVRLPANTLSFDHHAVGVFIDIGVQTLITGLQVASPGAAVLMITDVSFAFLNRAIPQMNVFFVGMPIKVMVGFVLVSAILPLLTYVVANLISGSANDMGGILNGLSALHR